MWYHGGALTFTALSALASSFVVLIYGVVRRICVVRRVLHKPVYYARRRESNRQSARFATRREESTDSREAAAAPSRRMDFFSTRPSHSKGASTKDVFVSRRQVPRLPTISDYEVDLTAANSEPDYTPEQSIPSRFAPQTGRFPFVEHAHRDGQRDDGVLTRPDRSRIVPQFQSTVCLASDYSSGSRRHLIGEMKSADVVSQASGNRSPTPSSLSTSEAWSVSGISNAQQAPKNLGLFRSHAAPLFQRFQGQKDHTMLQSDESSCGSLPFHKNRTTAPPTNGGLPPPPPAAHASCDLALQDSSDPTGAGVRHDGGGGAVVVPLREPSRFNARCTGRRALPAPPQRAVGAVPPPPPLPEHGVINTRGN